MIPLPATNPGSPPARPAASASSKRRKPWLLSAAAKPLLFSLCLLPLASLVYGAVANTLIYQLQQLSLRGLHFLRRRQPAFLTNLM